MRLTSRDLEILEAVGKLHFTTTTQLARLYFGSRSGASKRLRKLLDAGLLKVWLRQLAEENIYSLTHAGLKALDASGIKVPRELDGNLEHLLALNDVRIHFAFGVEVLGGRLAWWRSEWDLRAHGKERIIPDALFAVRWEDAEHIFALEVENDTRYPQGILRKMLGYRATPELYGARRYRILVVGRDPPMLERYRQGVLAAGLGKDTWFAKLDDLDDFRRPVWQAGSADRIDSFLASSTRTVTEDTLGADLYIHSSFDKAQRKYKPKFEEFVRKRDITTNGRQEYYQRKVGEYFDKMHGDGYYRDSYNDSNLLWKLGLDYWGWFASFLDEERLLHPDKAEIVLNEVMNRRHLLGEIEDLEERKYFEEKFDQFTHFLEMAIGRGEPVECSI